MCDAVCRNWEGNARSYLFFTSKPCITVRVEAGMPAWGDSNYVAAKKVFASFPRCFWRFPTKFQWFKKIVQVLEPRTGLFSRTWRFEAKVKDFKMCPWGRPRGLHLWRGLNRKSQAMMSSEIFQKRLFMGQRLKGQKLEVWFSTQPGFAKGKGLKS